MELRCQRLTAGALLPTRANPGDAGLDLYAAETAGLAPAGGRASVGTGIAVEIPDGHAGLVLPRSGLAAKHGIALVNAPGLIDSSYRGELRVLLLNTDPVAAYEVEPGKRIAQLLVVGFPTAEAVEVEELSPTARMRGLLSKREVLATAELERIGRTAWAREEFALLEGTRWVDEEPGMSYMRMKGARDLSRRELAVLRELVPWRDSVAGALDRATFRVLGNEQLLEIAHLVHERTELERLDLDRGIASSGVEDHSLHALAVEQLTGELDSIAVGKLDVHDRSVEHTVGPQRALDAAHAHHFVSEPPQPDGNDRGQRRMVLDD